jgi:two-component system chemotaxis response regulator CheB
MHDIVVVGGSAGALEGLFALVQDVPESLDASICVVLHSAESGLALVPRLLQRRSRLAIRVAADGDRVRRGHLYLPPPDHHLLLKPGRVIVNRGPKQNRFRPAIDPLFVSAATAYGPRAVGILLSGLLDDGVHGLSEIRRAGGIVVVQDPDDAPIPVLPINALQAVRADHVVAASGMGRLLETLSISPARKTAASRQSRKAQSRKAKKETRLMQSDPTRIPKDPPSPFTCPECDGALWLTPGTTPMYRCHVGHAYTPSALLAGQKEVSDQSTWRALRSLEEQAEMHRRFVPADAAAGEPRDFRRHAAALERRALILRRILIEREPGPRPGSAQARPRSPKPRARRTGRAAARRTS